MSEPITNYAAVTADGSTVIQVGQAFGNIVIQNGIEQFADDPVGECPYPGLSPFEPEQADWFFGRERELAELQLQLDRVRTEGGPVVLIGASGAGKTSLLRCGLINALTGKGFGPPGSRDWPRRVLTPTANPVRALIEALASVVNTDVGDPTAVRRALDGKLLLLVVDQFEEAFTACANVAERDRFVELLDRLSAGPDAPVLLVIGLRADFYGHCLAYPVLSSALRDSSVQLGPMSPGELERIVVKPAQQVGLVVQPQLVQRLLADMGGEESGRLPLLAHALRATWLKRTGNTLTLAGYQDTGGIRGAIAITADRTFARLSDGAKVAARLVFLRLVRIGSDTEDTRRHVGSAELVRGLPDPASVSEVVNAYTDRRLLTRERDGVTITHEALLRAWGTLRSWIDDDRAGNLVRQELDAAAAGWEARTRGLLDEVSLRTGEAWSAEHRAEITAPVAALLAASRRVVTLRRRSWRIFIAVALVLALAATGFAIYAVNQQEQAVAQRNTATARLVATEAQNLLDTQPGLAKQLAVEAYHLDNTTGAALMAALTKPGIYDSADSVVDVAETPDARLLALSTGSSIALWRTSGTEAARISGLSKVGGVAFGQTGQVLAAAVGTSVDAEVWLWTIPNLDYPPAMSLADPHRPQPLPVGDPVQLGAPVKLPAAGVDAIAIGGNLLAAGRSDGAIQLWDITNPAKPRALPSLAGHAGGTDSVAFANTAPLLASSGADHQVRLWSVVDPSAPSLLSTVDGNHADYSGSAYTPAPHLLAFSPSEAILAAPGVGLGTMTNDGTDTGNALRFWDVRDPTSPKLLATGVPDLNMGGKFCEGSVLSIAYSPEGDTVVTTCPDSGVYFWHAPRFGQAVDQDAIGYLAGVALDGNGPSMFTPRDHHVLHATRAGVEDWDVTNPARPGALITLGALPSGIEVPAMAIGPPPRQLLAVVGSGHSDVWDLQHMEKVAALPGGDPAAEAAAFSLNGDILADSEASDNGPALRLRDTTKPNFPVLSTLSSDVDNGAVGLAFSPDDKVLTVADNAEIGFAVLKSPTVKLFDITDPRSPKLITKLSGDVFSVEYSSDGRLLIGNTANAMLLWDMSDPRHPVALPTVRMTDAASNTTSLFSRNGSLLAAGDSTGEIAVWRVVDDRLSGNPGIARSPGFAGESLAFSPDNQTLALNAAETADDKAHIELWGVSGALTPILQSVFGPTSNSPGLAPLVYSPDGRTLVTGVDGTIDLWAADAGDNVSTLCQSIGDVITPAQWQRYVPNVPYAPPCGS